MRSPGENPMPIKIYLRILRNHKVVMYDFFSFFQVFPIKESKRQTCEYQNSINIQLQQKTSLTPSLMADLKSHNPTGKSTVLNNLLLVTRVVWKLLSVELGVSKDCHVSKNFTY